jgi:predicted permease
VVLSRESRQTSLRVAATRGRRIGVAQHALVVGEVAAAFVLSIGALLLLQTYVALRPTSPGFRVEDRVVADFDLPDEPYRDLRVSHRFATEVLERVRSLPGSPRAELATHLPLTGLTMILPARGDGSQDVSEVHVRAVSPGYLDLMEMEVAQGRGLEPADREGAPPVLVVNETAARRLWNTVDVIGRKATIDLGGAEVELDVVGVLRDTWIRRGPQPSAEVFASFDQLPFAFFTVVVESSPERPVVLEDLRGVVNSIDRGVPIRRFTTLEDIAAETVAQPRFQATLLGALTLIGVMLAATGCFAVLMQLVGQRTRELGVRLTMGASVHSVAGLVLRRALVLGAIGTGLGMSLALFATRLLENQIYGIARNDVSTFVLAALAMLVVVSAAALVPAARVTRLDPVEAMRAP